LDHALSQVLEEFAFIHLQDALLLESDHSDKKLHQERFAIEKKHLEDPRRLGLIKVIDEQSYEDRRKSGLHVKLRRLIQVGEDFRAFLFQPLLYLSQEGAQFRRVITENVPPGVFTVEQLLQAPEGILIVFYVQ